MQGNEANRVLFIADYYDGSQRGFLIDVWSLRTGDHVARTIAREQQEAGTLCNQPIKGVRRAPDSLQSLFRFAVAARKQPSEPQPSGPERDGPVEVWPGGWCSNKAEASDLMGAVLAAVDGKTRGF